MRYYDIFWISSFCYIWQWNSSFQNPNTFSPFYGNFTHLMFQYAYHVIMQEERILHHLPPSNDDPLTMKIILVPLYNSSDLTDVELGGNSVCFDANGGKRICAENPFELPSPNLEVNEDSVVCANVVSKVKYTVIYNNTEGIQSVRVQFILRDITAKDLPLRQSFEVIHLQPSHKLPRGPEMVSLVRHKKSERSDSKKPEKYSGNPGYLDGAPLRVGTLEIGQQWKMAAIKLMDDDQPGLTMLTSDLKGDCQTTQSREPVRFGVNMRSGCFIRFKFTDLRTACNQSQWATWIALRGPDPPTHIATYGNSDPHIVGDWVEILEADARPHPDSAVYDDQRPGICFNVLSGLDIQIIFAKTGSFENAQSQIIGARFNYFYTDYLQCLGSACHSSANAWEQKFEVTSSVTFTDASKPAIGVEGVVKTIHASLPLNFFYPFGSEDV